MNKLKLFAAAAVTALSTASAVQAADPIRIGAVISKTGPAAFLGEPQDVTLRHYVDKINADGGLLGRQVELIIYDDATNANNARTFSTRLVEEDKVVAMIGASTTGATLAIAPVFEDAEIPMVSLGAGIGIIEPARPYVFKTPHTDQLVCSKIITHMTSQGHDQIALVTGTGGVGKSMRKECTAAAEGAGIKVVADETFNPKDVDMSPQLTRIKGTEGVDAVFVGGFGQPLAVVTRNYAQLGLPFPQYHSHGSASQVYIDLAEGAAEGVLVTGPLLVVGDKLDDNNPLKPAAVEYANTYTELTGEAVSSFGGYAYDALLLITNAITTAGSDDPAAIRDAIEATQNLPGVTGMYNMSASDHLGIDQNSLFMVVIKDGNWVMVE